MKNVKMPYEILSLTRILCRQVSSWHKMRIKALTMNNKNCKEYLENSSPLINDVSELMRIMTIAEQPVLTDIADGINWLLINDDNNDDDEKSNTEPESDDGKSNIAPSLEEHVLDDETPQNGGKYANWG